MKTLSHDSLAVRTQGLTKRYGRVLAVDELSLEVPRGSVFGLLGPNGSGKTTTMSILLGLVRPTSGAFHLLARGIPHKTALKRVGAIIEAPSFYHHLSGRDNLAYFQGIVGRGASRDIDGLLDRVGLTDRAGDRYRTYSLGMKQRLGIAGSLLGDPELIFLDEPTNGMDPAGMAEIRELVHSLGDGDRTVLLSSHLLHEVEQVCDHVAIMSKGKLVAQGPVADLIHSRERIRLTTTDNVAAQVIVAGLAWVEEVTCDGAALVVSGPLARSRELSAALSAANIDLTEMSPVRNSLERYFLEVTSEDEAG